MTDINSLQQQWQQKFELITKDEATAVSEKKIYDEKLAAIEERMKNSHGLSRLKKPFIKATKIVWFHHKQKKFTRHITRNESKITALAANTLATLGETVTIDSTHAVEFSRLKTVIGQIQTTQNIVKSAADKCSSASSSESIAAFGDNKGLDLMAKMETSDATDAVKNAEQAVKKLQQTLQQEMPQVSDTLADHLSRSNSNTFMADMFGGFMGTFANWNMADKLDDAESHLNDIADQLGTAIKKFTGQKSAVVTAALMEARKADSTVESFASTLENYMLPAEMWAAPKKVGLRLIRK